MKLEKISYKNSYDMKELHYFLEENNLRFDSSCDYTVVLRDLDEKIVATASKSKNILKCFAIDNSLRGLGVSGTLITHITNKMFEEGFYSSFVFTKVDNLDLFLNMGYKEIAKTDKVALLEIGINSIEKKLNSIKTEYSIDTDKKIKRAMIVMNCNPFTKGHRYLIEKAARENDEVLIFVVEEDSSIFPFDVRFNLVKLGTHDLNNVKVLPGTEYIISSATFPNYFLKKDDDFLGEYIKLDITISGKRFVPFFNIYRRYLGEEPFCSVTKKYNEGILDIYPKFGVEVSVIKRVEIGNRAVSATEVREVWKNGNLERLSEIVPDSTYNFLVSDDAKSIKEKLLGK